MDTADPSGILEISNLHDIFVVAVVYLCFVRRGRMIAVTSPCQEHRGMKLPSLSKIVISSSSPASERTRICPKSGGISESMAHDTHLLHLRMPHLLVMFRPGHFVGYLSSILPGKIKVDRDRTCLSDVCGVSESPENTHILEVSSISTKTELLMPAGQAEIVLGLDDVWLFLLPETSNGVSSPVRGIPVVR